MITERLKRRGAMMREIALKRGNFRGVCPTIGRLSEGCTRRISPGAAKTGLLCAGFFVAWSDTHESVYEARLPYEVRDNRNSTSYLRRKQTTWQLRKK